MKNILSIIQVTPYSFNNIIRCYSIFFCIFNFAVDMYTIY
jgi:hypothetical protein